VQRERQVLRRVEDLHAVGEQFDRAGLELVVRRQPATQRAGDTQAVLIADLAGTTAGEGSKPAPEGKPASAPEASTAKPAAPAKAAAAAD
jgi:hypothetical protein